MSHSWGRGYDLIEGDKSHMFIYQHGNHCHITGAKLKPIPNQPDGTLKLEDFEASITPAANVSDHFCITRVVCLENAQNLCGGLFLTPQYC